MAQAAFFALSCLAPEVPYKHKNNLLLCYVERAWIVRLAGVGFSCI